MIAFFMSTTKKASAFVTALMFLVCPWYIILFNTPHHQQPAVILCVRQVTTAMQKEAEKRPLLSL